MTSTIYMKENMLSTIIKQLKKEDLKYIPSALLTVVNTYPPVWTVSFNLHKKDFVFYEK